MKIIKVGAVLFLATLLSACGDRKLIGVAKDEVYPGHTGTTFAKVIGNYDHCDDKSWSVKELNTGEKYVEFSCIASSPKNIKEAMAPAIARAEKAAEEETSSAKNNLQTSIEAAKGSAYSLQVNARKAVESTRDRIEKIREGRVEPFGDTVESLDQRLQQQMAELELAHHPERIAEAEAEFQKSSAEEQADYEKHSKMREEKLAQQRKALVDGKMKILIQWSVDTNGQVSGIATGVNFDFGEWSHFASGKHGLTPSILEAIYQNRPILDGLRRMFAGYWLGETDDAGLLFFASWHAMDKLNKK